MLYIINAFSGNVNVLSVNILFSHRIIIETEVIRAVAGLGVLKHYAVTVIRLAADDSDTVVVPDIQVEIFFIDLCHFFDGHDPFAVDDRHVQRFFQIFIDGMLCDLFCQSRYSFFEKIVVVDDQRNIVEIMDSLNIINFGIFRKTGESCLLLGHMQFCEQSDMCVCLLTISCGRFCKSLNFPNRKGCLFGWLINISDTLSLHGLYIAVTDQKCNCTAKSVSGTIVNLDQSIFRGKKLLVGKGVISYFQFEIFAPLIPAIITGGLILGFRNCIDSMYLFENGTKTLCDISQFWAGLDSFLWLIGEAIFHMLPVGICWSVTKKMGTTQMLGIVLGLTLVSGQLLNAYAVAGTAAADIPKWDFGFVKVNMIGYQAQVLPAILAAFVLVYLEKFFRKITPQVISMVVVPFCSLVLAVMAAHFVVGPIGWKIGSAISAVVCVATNTTANAVGVGGIPGILSIQPKYMGSFAVCMLIAFAVPLALTFIVGKKKLSPADMGQGTEGQNTADSDNTEKVIEAAELKAFLTGKVISLKEVGDGVFSEGVMGDGLAIIPENDTLYAPADAEVSMIMEESGHACGLTLANGMEVLLHVGIDTVDMKGDGFKYLVSQDQKVKAGTPLIRFDRDKIKAAGHPDVTVCIITEEGNAKNIQFKTGIQAEANKTEIASFE